MSTKISFRILVVVQLLLILIAFNKAWVHPHEYFFSESGDGYKNYLAYYGYIAEEHNAFNKFEGMNYPYGEYIYYPDMTPSVAVPMKLISRYLVDITGIAIPIYNLLIILGILWSSILCFWILKRIIRTPTILLIASLSLPWLCPQFLRISHGHFNLSLSCLLLWTIFLSIRIEERWSDGRKARISSFLWLFAALYFSAFTHLYYIALAGVAISAYFFGRILWQDHQTNGQWARMLLVFGTIVLALVAVVGTIQLTDPIYHERKTTPMGYDFIEWRLNIWALYMPYRHLSFPIPTVEKIFTWMETRMFLSYFFWYALIFLILLRMLEPTYFRRFWKGRSLKHSKVELKAPIRWIYALVFAGVVGSIIALGENLIHFEKGKIPNFLNPFYYLHFFTDRVEQFRCLARFAWVFFWAINFMMLFWIDQIWQMEGKKWIRRSLIFLMFLLGLQVAETVSYQNSNFSKNRLTLEKYSGDAIELAKQFNPEDFQAILSIPFYAVGSEVYPITIDPPDELFHLSSRLYIQTGLPTMAFRSGRTSIPQNEAQFSLFLGERPDKDLVNRLNDKDILILYSKQLNADFSWYQLNMEPGKTVVQGGQAFINKYQPEEIFQNDGYILYRLDVSKLKN
ncbi:MAG: hypothetical protein AAF598_14080 [Bacteroidota bacterium]